MVHYCYIWKATFPNFVTVIKPSNLHGTKLRNLCVLVHIFAIAFHLSTIVHEKQ